MKVHFFFFLLIGSFLFSSCGDDSLSQEEQLAVDLELMQTYIAENNMDAQSTDSGLHYVVLSPGIGENRPTASSRVRVKYKGYFLDGRVFDQTADGDSIEFPLSGVINGWEEGLQLMKKNARYTFIIPSYLAYGTSGQGSVPGNTVLLFDVELMNFD